MAFQQQDTGEGPSKGRGTPRGTTANKVFSTLPCSRCGHISQYYEGTHWSEVSKMVTDHWETCPNSIRSILSANIDETATNGYEATPAMSSTTGASAAHATIDPPDEAETSAHATGEKKNVMNEQERKEMLEADEWATDVTPTSVKCVACGRPISLDKRSRYYPGLWFKHRSKCFELKRLEAIRRLQGDLREPNNPPVTEPTSNQQSQGQATLLPENKDDAPS